MEVRGGGFDLNTLEEIKYKKAEKMRGAKSDGYHKRAWSDCIGCCESYGLCPGHVL
jgi:hypothetical protein